MTTEIADWIDAAARETKIRADRLGSEEERSVYEYAKARFVTGNPRVWWMSLKYDAKVFRTYDAALASLHVPFEESCYLIPETECDPCVFRLKLKDVGKLLSNCPFFEYYIVDLDCIWLITESDHNECFVVRAD